MKLKKFIFIITIIIIIIIIIIFIILGMEISPSVTKLGNLFTTENVKLLSRWCFYTGQLHHSVNIVFSKVTLESNNNFRVV